MDVTPSQVSSATFRTVRKGYDPDEVDAFLDRVAQALENCQQQATAMEARARAAVSRLQEMQASDSIGADTKPLVRRGDAPADQHEDHDAGDRAEHDIRHDGEHDEHGDDADVRVSPDEAETISRTLLLAQRTADTTVAAAEADAERIRHEAQTEAESTIDSTREMSARLLEEARTEARQATEAERQAAENEVQSLKARREFLIGDVDHLEAFLVDQRERLRGAARQIEALCDRVPAGLGEARPPTLSASDDEPGDHTAELFIPPEAAVPFASVDVLADALEDADPELVTPVITDDGDIDADDAPELPMRGDNPASD